MEFVYTYETIDCALYRGVCDFCTTDECYYDESNRFNSCHYCCQMTAVDDSDQL